MNILVSACLLGVECRYDGKGKKLHELEDLKKKHNLIPICPEIYGGLPIPREPAERVADRFVTKSGKDVTSHFQKGALEIVNLAKMLDCSVAILKQRSPSCGFGEIYDGTFTKTLIKGNGILAQQLEEMGVKIVNETNVGEISSYLSDC